MVALSVEMAEVFAMDNHPTQEKQYVELRWSLAENRIANKSLRQVESGNTCDRKGQATLLALHSEWHISLLQFLLETLAV